MLSRCCGARVLKARSSAPWKFDGCLVKEWYECCSCHQRCDTVEGEVNKSLRELQNDRRTEESSSDD